jgi:hypothetical protein
MKASDIFSLSSKKDLDRAIKMGAGV